MSGFENAINLAGLVLCIVFIAYVAVILVPFLRRKPADTGDAGEYQWNFIIPCLNERAVIASTLRRLRRDHPEAHLWCVDDDSDDATADIIGRLSAKDEHIHLVQRRKPEARQGKGEALNAAWRRIREAVAGDPAADPEKVIVAVLDADARLDPDALAKVAGSAGFADPDVGAVQVQVRMINRGTDTIDGELPAAETRFGRLLVALQDVEFRTVIAAMQHTRHLLSSAGMGGNGQFSRMSTLLAVAEEAGSPWHGALLEDFEFGLHVLMAGKRNRYCDDAWVAQEGLPDLPRLIRQRTRWAQGGMQCIKYFLPILRSKRISAPSALEICYFLLVPWTQLLGTFVYGSAFALILSYAVTDPDGVGAWFTAGAWALVPLMILFGVAPLALWGFVYRSRCEPAIGRLYAFVLAVAHWLYSYAMLISVWSAFGRLLRGRTDWAKTARVAAVPSSSTIATD